MAQTTRGGLTPAKIFESDKDGKKKGSLEVSFMFNPNQYVVAQTNTFKDKSAANARPNLELSQAGHQTLQLKQLVFDTYEDKSDVSKETRKLWQLMKPVPGSENPQGNKPTGRYVTFRWGTFEFVSVITQVSQTFTLFTDKGQPVRALVDVTFTQYEDREDYKPQNPTSGGGMVQQVWQVVQGDRLDAIAASVYHDATKWRKIAAFNGIKNPLDLQAGRNLRIPIDE